MSTRSQVNSLEWYRLGLDQVFPSYCGFASVHYVVDASTCNVESERNNIFCTYKLYCIMFLQKEFSFVEVNLLLKSRKKIGTRTKLLTTIDIHSESYDLGTVVATTIY